MTFQKQLWRPPGVNKRSLHYILLLSFISVKVEFRRASTHINLPKPSPDLHQSWLRCFQKNGDPAYAGKGEVDDNDISCAAQFGLFQLFWPFTFVSIYGILLYSVYFDKLFDIKVIWIFLDWIWNEIFVLSFIGTYVKYRLGDFF